MVIVLWNKKYTETLAETLKRFRLEKCEYNNEKVTYAGRLDPMAEGLLLLLTGDDVHKKEDFLGLDKVYEIDFIFGIETDTYDVLGESKVFNNFPVEIKRSDIIKRLDSYVGEHNQPYPPYSSKHVSGKALFAWAREGKINKIVIPTKDIEIYSIKYLQSRLLDLASFENELIFNIKNVVGDFRQESIVENWRNIFIKSDNSALIDIHTIRVHASSGAYMRTLIHNIGKSLNTNACTVKIKRIQIGNYQL